MKKLLATLAIGTTLALSGCSTVGGVANGLAENELVVQYSTIKIIKESDRITSEGVVDAVAKARLVLDADSDVTIDELKLRVADKIEWETIAPEDRLLILAVVNEVQANLKEKYELDLISDEVEFKIREFLDTVEYAAQMSKGY